MMSKEDNLSAEEERCLKLFNWVSLVNVSNSEYIIVVNPSEYKDLCNTFPSDDNKIDDKKSLLLDIDSIDDEQKIKFLREDMNHNEYKYKLGINKLPESEKFDPNGSCKGGGLYFTNGKNKNRWSYFGPLIAFISLPEDTLVYAEPCGTKWKANQICIDRIETWRRETMGVDYSYKHLWQKYKKYILRFIYGNIYSIETKGIERIKELYDGYDTSDITDVDKILSKQTIRMMCENIRLKSILYLLKFFNLEKNNKINILKHFNVLTFEHIKENMKYFPFSEVAEYMNCVLKMDIAKNVTWLPELIFYLDNIANRTNIVNEYIQYNKINAPFMYRLIEKYQSIITLKNWIHISAHYPELISDKNISLVPDNIKHEILINLPDNYCANISKEIVKSVLENYEYHLSTNYIITKRVSQLAKKYGDLYPDVFEPIQCYILRQYLPSEFKSTNTKSFTTDEKLLTTDEKLLMVRKIMEMGINRKRMKRMASILFFKLKREDIKQILPKLYRNIQFD